VIKRIKSGIAGKNFGFDYLEWIRKIALRFRLKGIAFLKKDGTIEVIA
jgi:acylphosphatase